LWFLPFGGVSVIDPHRLPFNALPPPVHIEQVVADGKTYVPANGLPLPSRVRDVSIDFTALSLVAPEKVHFKYMLEGQDPEWREFINDRQAQYTNLGPRSYRFRVIACNNSGVWNETGDTLEFSIAPAYYQTTLFYASCVATFLAMLWGLYRLRLHQIAREFNAQLDGRVDERLRVARDLHDTMLQTFQAALIQMQAGYNLLSRRPEKAAEAIQKAITTSAGAIAEGREAIQNMRSSTITRNDLARALRAAGDQMAAEAPASFDVRVQGSSRDLHPILRDEVYRIALEALRNAFKHAEAHAIEAEILYGDGLRVRVRDDGKGIDPAVMKEGLSGHYGLHGMRERAGRIGGKLDVWTGAGAGTEIQLSIPGSIAFGRSGAGSRFRRFRAKGKSEAGVQG
jgi:signal transduction histidine kinase